MTPQEKDTLVFCQFLYHIEINEPNTMRSEVAVMLLHDLEPYYEDETPETILDYVVDNWTDPRNESSVDDSLIDFVSPMAKLGHTITIKDDGYYGEKQVALVLNEVKRTVTELVKEFRKTGMVDQTPRFCQFLENIIKTEKGNLRAAICEQALAHSDKDFLILTLRYSSTHGLKIKGEAEKSSYVEKYQKNFIKSGFDKVDTENLDEVLRKVGEGIYSKYFNDLNKYS